MADRHDLRRHERQDSDSTVVVMWRDASGNDKFANARALDISDVGLRLQMPEPLRPQSYITLRAEKLGIHGQASVRHCSGRGGKYIIGVEFSAGLRRPRSA